jgi:hypothetical protein
MLLRPFLYETTACASYLFGCGSQNRLAVVDPHIDLVDDSWGAQTRSSRRGFVFVEQPPRRSRRLTCSGKGLCRRSIGSVAALRRAQVECWVWTLLVEVADVDAEDVLELAATED